MGSPDDDDEVEKQRRVRLTRAIAVSDRETTWAQFQAFDGGSHQASWSDQFNRKLEGNEPVFGVNWFESVAYCRWLSREAGIAETDQCHSAEPLTKNQSTDPGWVNLPAITQWPVDLAGIGFRPPTDAEWELACRGGTTSRSSFGSDPALADRYAWCSKNSKDWSHAGASLRPNPRGLFDMHGNLWEWTHDSFDTTPSQTVDPAFTDNSADRVTRGGGWNEVTRKCTSSRRDGAAAIVRSSNVGFRVAIVPPLDERRRQVDDGEAR